MIVNGIYSFFYLQLSIFYFLLLLVLDIFGGFFFVGMIAHNDLLLAFFIFFNILNLINYEIIILVKALKLCDLSISICFFTTFIIISPLYRYVAMHYNNQILNLNIKLIYKLIFISYLSNINNFSLW
jgi:hypothetical protein